MSISPSTSSLTTRQFQVLLAAIDSHLNAGGPVASGRLVRRHGLQWSPATIRSTLADLEKMGYLAQPHTSAGRLPTDRAYRLYVDLICGQKVCNAELVRRIEHQVEASDVTELLECASRVLASLSSQLALVTAPAFDEAHLRRLRLLSVAPAQILVVLEFLDAPVATVLVELQSEVAEASIRGVETHLNERLSGLRLDIIRRTIAKRLDRLVDAQAETVRRELVSSRNRVFLVDSTRSLYVGGAANILGESSPEKAVDGAAILRILEDEERASGLIGQVCGDGRQTVVRVGSENSAEELRSMSLVASVYRIGAGHGVIGLIGPRRMSYASLIPLVEFTARHVSSRAETIGAA